MQLLQPFTYPQVPTLSKTASVLAKQTVNYVTSYPEVSQNLYLMTEDALKTALIAIPTELPGITFPKTSTAATESNSEAQVAEVGEKRIPAEDPDGDGEDAYRSVD